jgi:hypothetical protein
MANLLAQVGEDYSPLSPEYELVDENQTYLPRTAAVSRGQWIAGDISLYEYRGGPALQPILNPILSGTLNKLTGSIERTFLIATGLYSAIIFLLIYFFFYLLTKTRAISLAVAFPKGSQMHIFKHL